jgi:hypothetical protein
VLVNGARHQLGLIHVLEYLWDAAWCLHQADDPAAEAFVAHHARTILDGGAEQVATALDKAAYLR